MRKKRLVKLSELCVSGALAIASTLVAPTPANAATRTCVSDAYDWLTATPPAGCNNRRVRVSINGVWPGSGPLITPATVPYSYFGKTFANTGYNATYGGSMLQSTTLATFPLWYDSSVDPGAYYNLPSQQFAFQAIPLDDAYPVRLSGNGGLNLIDAHCSHKDFSTEEILSGFDQYGYSWTMTFAKLQTCF